MPTFPGIRSHLDKTELIDGHAVKGSLHVTIPLNRINQGEHLISAENLLHANRVADVDLLNVHNVEISNVQVLNDEGEQMSHVPVGIMFKNPSTNEMHDFPTRDSVIHDGELNIFHSVVHSNSNEIGTVEMAQTEAQMDAKTKELHTTNKQFSQHMAEARIQRYADASKQYAAAGYPSKITPNLVESLRHDVVTKNGTTDGKPTTMYMIPVTTNDDASPFTRSFNRQLQNKPSGSSSNSIDWSKWANNDKRRGGDSFVHEGKQYKKATQEEYDKMETRLLDTLRHDSNLAHGLSVSVRARESDLQQKPKQVRMKLTFNRTLNKYSDAEPTHHAPYTLDQSKMADAAQIQGKKVQEVEDVDTWVFGKMGKALDSHDEFEESRYETIDDVRDPFYKTHIIAAEE